MSVFVDLNLPIDYQDAYARLLASWAIRFPGISLSEARPIEAALEAGAHADTQNAQVGQRIHAAAFDAYGAKLLGVVRNLGAPAQMPSTWTMRDSAGYTIPADQIAVIYAVTGSDLAVFRPATDIIVPAGSTQVTGITLTADQTGSDRNGLAVAPLRLGVADARIATVVSTAPTTGGVDPETDVNWLNRIAAENQLASRNAIYEADLSTVARRIDEVWRARGIGRYDAITGTPNSPGHGTLVPVNIAGQPVSAAAKAALVAEVTGDDTHLANVTLHVIDPNYVPVAVDYTAAGRPGFDKPQVKADGIAVLTALLEPAGWAGGRAQPPRWDPIDTIYRHDLIAALYNVPGIGHVFGLTLNGGTADVVLAGVAGLPNPTVTGTVT